MAKNKRPNFFVRIFRFWFPKDFMGDFRKGIQMGKDIAGNPEAGQAGKIFQLPFQVGKGIRKVIDPKHKMNIGKKKK